MILLDSLKEKLRDIYDLERLMSRISYGNANARDFISLKQSIEVLPDIKLLLSDAKSDILKEFHSNLDTLEDIYEIINKAIIDEPPVTIKEGNIIKNGYNSQLDKYREALTQGKTWIAKLEQKEREKTGIRTLKVGFNKVFGYYIDVTKSYYDLVPDYYIRKQTLANSERFIIPELKEVEDNILGAEEKSIKLEYQLFTEIRENISFQVNRIQHTALIISQLDALWALAKTAIDNNYVRPIIISDGSINILDGRHPVVEKTLLNGQFVPNDTHLNMSDERLVIITGPNMAGKSTYMRQVALIVLMAQIGSFVPAKKAEVSIVDRIFTRVGASDDLSLGQSTFMVEMSEVSNILHNATSNSLLILDEIGRGTSTFDGLSIAWSVVEHIADPEKLGAKTLFATHYHELTELEGKLPGVKNYRVAVKEKGDDIIFLRKIMQGGADRSFGIQVAKLAGLPAEVVDRAKVILQQLENEKDSNTEITEDIKINESSEQLTFFASQSHKIEEELKAVDIVNITPMEAMNILYDLVQKVRKKRS
jgi:DNA mismatch repair protein MutS